MSETGEGNSHPHHGAHWVMDVKTELIVCHFSQ